MDFNFIKNNSLFNKGFVPLLALDHGLTNGNTDSVDLKNVKQLLIDCEEHISGVVMTYGLAKYLNCQAFSTSLILQCFGAPNNKEKVLISSVDQALSLNANAISIQIKFQRNNTYKSSQISLISRVVYQANINKLPVLFMVTSEDEDIQSIVNAIRISQELGADLIKIRVNFQNFSQKDLGFLTETISTAPPVLLSGGAVNGKLNKELSIAMNSCSFSGYCVGRNIFDNIKPLNQVIELNKICSGSYHE